MRQECRRDLRQGLDEPATGATRKTPSTAMSLTVDIVLGHNIVAIKRDIV